MSEFETAIDAARERARRERAERDRPDIAYTSEANRQGAALVRAALAKAKEDK